MTERHKSKSIRTSKVRSERRKCDQNVESAIIFVENPSVENMIENHFVENIKRRRKDF
jgi:hypothetical protein